MKWKSKGIECVGQIDHDHKNPPRVGPIDRISDAKTWPHPCTVPSDFGDGALSLTSIMTGMYPMTDAIVLPASSENKTR